MSLTVVVGGQFGSEGKGKVCSYLAQETDLAVRSGGPNSGHTVSTRGTTYRLQQIPSTFLNPKCRVAIAAGAVIDLDVLLREMRACEVEDRLTVDPAAVVVDPSDIKAETNLRARIASTMTGTGAAMARKVLRSAGIRLAKDVPELQHYLGNVADLANDFVDLGRNVLLEGSQGVGLSLHHGPFPFVTGRDTTPGTLCGEVGVSPLLVTTVMLVVRTFPIRVAGNSGPLDEEVDWSTVTFESESPLPLVERTTVTRGIRRVGRFSWDVVLRSIKLARPNQIALNFLDYLDHRDYSGSQYDSLSARSIRFVEAFRERTGIAPCLLGTGPDVTHCIDRRPTFAPHSPTAVPMSR